MVDRQTGVPHWHVYRDYFPHEPRSPRRKRRVFFYPSEEAARSTLANLPARYGQAAGRPPNRVLFDHMSDGQDPVIDVDGKVARLRRCDIAGCTEGLGEVD